MAFFTRRQPPQPDGRYEALEAEYRNYRRRTALELEDAAGKSARQTVLPFLSLYDDLNRALACPCGDAAFYQGVELIYKRLLQTLTDLGVKPMDSLGRMFNPTYHEAVEMISDPKYRRDEIVEVLQVGFTMDDEVVREARVGGGNCE